ARDADRLGTVSWDERERAEWIGVQVPQQHGASLRQLGEHADERVQLFRTIEEPGQHEHARREAQLRGDAERRADVGEAVALGPVQGVVGRGARGDHPHRDALDAGGGETAQPRGERAVRLEVDRRRGGLGADAARGRLDLARDEERLTLAGPAECEERPARSRVLDREPATSSTDGWKAAGSVGSAAPSRFGSTAAGGRSFDGAATGSAHSQRPKNAFAAARQPYSRAQRASCRTRRSPGCARSPRSTCAATSARTYADASCVASLSMRSAATTSAPASSAATAA